MTLAPILGLEVSTPLAIRSEYQFGGSVSCFHFAVAGVEDHVGDLERLLQTQTGLIAATRRLPQLPRGLRHPKGENKRLLAQSLPPALVHAWLSLSSLPF
jgi:hypothetical protein